MSSHEFSVTGPVLQVVEDPRQGCVWEVTTPGTRARFSSGVEAFSYLLELQALHAITPPEH